MSDIIIVDNTDAGNFLNFENYVPITDFVGDKDDLQL